MIYSKPFRASLPSNAQFPCLALEKDNWNDFGFQTLFKLYFYPDSNRKEEVGMVKILEKGETVTNLERSYNKLPDSFCSLGNSLEYYKKIYELFSDKSNSILSLLNDCAIDRTIYENFKNEKGFTTSLIRFSEEEKALYQAQEILNGETRDKNFSFSFSCKLEGASREHKVDIDFTELGEGLPNRIFCLIGRNGTGKTQYLGQLALGMSGQVINLKKGFHPLRPLFSRIIALSYSIFDDFTKPESTERFSYNYFGFKENGLIKDDGEIQKSLRNSIYEIIKKEKQAEWVELLKSIIEVDRLQQVIKDVEERKSIHVYKKLGVSSGQGVILNFVSHVLSVITDDSLIIFDEPEMHLHPNAISQLIKILYDLLEATNSYAILATHSPIIVQQIPSKYVRVIDRVENTPRVRGVTTETFGENLSAVTNEVFGNINEEDYYKIILRKVSDHLDSDAINSAFENKLSFNAKIFFESLAHEEESHS